MFIMQPLEATLVKPFRRARNNGCAPEREREDHAETEADVIPSPSPARSQSAESRIGQRRDAGQRDEAETARPERNAHSEQ